MEMTVPFTSKINPTVFSPTMRKAPPLPTPLQVRQPVLKVIGLGGAGSNAVNHMIDLGLTGVEYIAANTDAQALKNSQAPIKIQLGPNRTRGLGAGGNPQIGQSAAEESYRELTKALEGADMVFIAAGMGGGTGTGSAPIAAQIARSLGAVTASIVTMPFDFEGSKRSKNARLGIETLRPYSDTLIIIPNQHVLNIAERNMDLVTAFRMADDMLHQGIQGITELITRPGKMNIAFSHIREKIQNGGGSVLSIGSGDGEGKAIKAVRKALEHRLLQHIDIENASGFIANFTGGNDLSLAEVEDAMNYLQAAAHGNADGVLGSTLDITMENHAEVILIVTGVGGLSIDQAQPSAPVEKTIQEHTLPKKPAPVAPQESPKQQTDAVRHISYDFEDLVDDEPIELPANAFGSPVEYLSPLRFTEAYGASNKLDVPAYMRRRN